jgi:hypothetical protein
MSEVQVPSTFTKRMVELEFSIIDVNRCLDISKAGRLAWRKRCWGAQTFDVVENLLNEFEQWFRKGAG